MNQPQEMEDYWRGLVEGFKKLGLADAIVPIGCFKYDTAKAIALELGLTVEVRGKDYVFHQNIVNKLMEEDAHRQNYSTIEREGSAQLEENFSHFENNNGNF